MKLIVFGANGKTGSLVVERALAAGHQVTIFVHTDLEHPASGVNVVNGDASDASSVRQAISGQDAVIDTIGGKTPYKATELEQTAARNIVEAMRAEGVRRLAVVSMLGIGESSENAPFWYEHLLMPTFLHGSTKDKTAMEATVQSSGLDFLIVRPPILTEIHPPAPSRSSAARPRVIRLPVPISPSSSSTNSAAGSTSATRWSLQTVDVLSRCTIWPRNSAPAKVQPIPVNCRAIRAT